MIQPITLELVSTFISFYCILTPIKSYSIFIEKKFESIAYIEI